MEVIAAPNPIVPESEAVELLSSELRPPVRTHLATTIITLNRDGFVSQVFGSKN